MLALIGWHPDPDPQRQVNTFQDSIIALYGESVIGVLFLILLAVCVLFALRKHSKLAC